MMVMTTAPLDDGGASRVTVANEGLHGLESTLLAEARQRLVSRAGLITGYRVLQVHRVTADFLRVVGWSDKWLGEWISKQGYGDGVTAEIPAVSRDQVAAALAIVASQIGADEGTLVDPLVLALTERLTP